MYSEIPIKQGNSEKRKVIIERGPTGTPTQQKSDNKNPGSINSASDLHFRLKEPSERYQTFNGKQENSSQQDATNLNLKRSKSK
jgi:hypothetical protein